MKKLDTSNFQEQSTKFSNIEIVKKLNEKETLIQNIKKLNRQRVFYEQSQQFSKALENQKKLDQISRQLQDHLQQQLDINYKQQISKIEKNKKSDRKKLIQKWKKIFKEFDEQTEIQLSKIQKKQDQIKLEEKLKIIEEKETKLVTSQILNLQHKLQNSIKLQSYEKADQFKQDLETLKFEKVNFEKQKFQKKLSKKTKNFEKNQNKLLNKEQCKLMSQRNELVLEKKQELKELTKSYKVSLQRCSDSYKKHQVDLQKYFKNFNPSSKFINLEFEESQTF